MNTSNLIISKGQKYGPPKTNFACIGELRATFNKYYSKNVHRDRLVAVAIDELIRKMARIATGTPDPENFKDILGYAQIGLNLTTPSSAPKEMADQLNHEHKLNLTPSKLCI